MATKSTLQALSDSKIKTNPTPILKAEHAAVNDDYLDEFYGETVIDYYIPGDDTTPITTPANANRRYSLRFLKQGRKVTVTGTLDNEAGTMLSNVKWFDIDSGEYTPESGVFNFSFGTQTNSVVLCSLTGSEFKVKSSIPIGAIIYVNCTYFTLN